MLKHYKIALTFAFRDVCNIKVPFVTCALRVFECALGIGRACDAPFIRIREASQARVVALLALIVHAIIVKAILALAHFVII
jgi:hypothetical protein